MKIPKCYNYDGYFNYRNSSWGWATWKDCWKKADWEIKDYNSFLDDKLAQREFNRGGEDMTRMLINQMEGKIDSWAIRWSYAQFRHNALSLYPIHSYVANIGVDGSGTHFTKKDTKIINAYAVDLTRAKHNIAFPHEVIINEKLMRSFRKQFKFPLRRKVKRKVKKILIKGFSFLKSR